jgi:hypothetical protein
VRKILIAFNIHLSTSDVSVAKAIAKVIRYSGGGLRHVKAIGVDLKSRGIAQVSINLTDFEQTPLNRVFEMTRREAERLGCQVTGSEIIGLVPQKALDQAAEFYLQLENYSPDRILENRLLARAAGSSSWSPVEILKDTNRAPAEIKSANSDGSAEVPGASRVVALVAARANLQAAIAGMELFERWIQLETAIAPSMLADFQAARDNALAAARTALDTAEANLKAILAVQDLS